MASRSSTANDVTPGLEKIADDIETFYSLGYRLIPSGQDRMHRIQVKVKGHPEYRLDLPQDASSRRRCRRASATGS